MFCHGDVFLCEKCGNARVESYNNRGGKILRTFEDVEYPSVLLSVEEDPMGYYVMHKGVCQECIEKYHYHILSEEEESLISFYPQRAEHFGGVKKYMEDAIERFSSNVSEKFLEELNPVALEKYKRKFGGASEDRNLLTEDLYVDEIKADIIAWIQKDVATRLAASQKRNRKRLRLLEEERKVKEFFAETEMCEGYCEAFSFSEVVRECLDGEEYVDVLSNLCMGKCLTTIEFYPTVKGEREDLLGMVSDPKFSVDVTEDAIAGMYEFRQLIRGLPIWLKNNCKE